MWIPTDVPPMRTQRTAYGLTPTQMFAQMQVFKNEVGELVGHLKIDGAVLEINPGGRHDGHGAVMEDCLRVDGADLPVRLTEAEVELYRSLGHQWLTLFWQGA